LNHLDLDSDNDGLLDSEESSVDSDGDGVADFVDLDSDNDGFTDVFEAGGTDENADGVIDNFVDVNLDGHDDGATVVPLPVPDTDEDGFADHLDQDSDNDGLPDISESGAAGADANSDGKIDIFIDNNNDGLSDTITPNQSIFIEGDSVSNHLNVSVNIVVDVEGDVIHSIISPPEPSQDISDISIAPTAHVGTQGHGCAVSKISSKSYDLTFIMVVTLSVIMLFVRSFVLYSIWYREQQRFLKLKQGVVSVSVGT